MPESHKFPQEPLQVSYLKLYVNADRQAELEKLRNGGNDAARTGSESQLAADSRYLE